MDKQNNRKTNGTPGKLIQLISGILCLAIAAAWGAAAVLGPLAIVKFCWLYLVQ